MESRLQMSRAVRLSSSLWRGTVWKRFAAGFSQIEWPRPSRSKTQSCSIRYRMNAERFNRRLRSASTPTVTRLLQPLRGRDRGPA